MEYIKKTKDISDGKSFAIFLPVRIQIPGDQRSIDAPGHGYPAYTAEHWDIETSANEEEWKDRIRKYSLEGIDFKAAILSTVKIKTETIVTVDIS